MNREDTSGQLKETEKFELIHFELHARKSGKQFAQFLSKSEQTALDVG